MTNLPTFGAGIWHFATYKDRYATDGYGLLEQIDRAGAVGDLSVVDLNWPFVGFDGTLDDIEAALSRNGERAAQVNHDALGAQRLSQKVLLSSMTEDLTQRTGADG